MKVLRQVIVSLCVVVMVSSCIRREYRLFRTDVNVVNDSIQALLKEQSPVFIIRPNDILELNVYSSKGERIIDPDLEYLNSGSMNANSTMTKVQERYLVQKDGSVFLPMIGKIVLGGYYMNEADSLLSSQYNAYYKDSYVKLKIINKRILVFGPMGGKVINLENENVNLVEALALYGGVNIQMRTDNLRIIRGDASNPDVEIVDLSTITGMRKAQNKLLPGDIVYIEPIKKVFGETMQEILPLAYLLTSLITLLVLIKK
jgi:polysaccharide biosynthesis/export protein